MCFIRGTFFERIMVGIVTRTLVCLHKRCPPLIDCMEQLEKGSAHEGISVVLADSAIKDILNPSLILFKVRTVCLFGLPCRLHVFQAYKLIGFFLLLTVAVPSGVLATSP